jgi:NitT/TauT family transport system permease protein
MRPRWGPRWWGVAIVAGALAGWEIASRGSRSVQFFAASPTAIAIDLWRMIRDGTFVRDLSITGAEAVSGLVIGMSVGTAFGLSLWLSERLAQAVRPVVLLLSAIPILAVAPMMIVWFGVGVPMKIAMASLTTVFIAFSQAYRGAQQVSADLTEIVAGLGAPRRRVLAKIVVPGAIDWVLNTIRLGIGMALLGAFMGEFVASQGGLGYRLLRSASLYNIPRAFAAAFGIVLLGVAFDGVAALLVRHRHTLVQWCFVPGLLRAIPHRRDDRAGETSE